MSASNIIKDSPAKGGGGSQPGSVLKRVIIDARAEAQRLITEAEARASELRESAELSGRTIREEAYREGRETALLELNEHLIAARETREAALAEVEPDVLRLAVKIAEKIIGREIERSDSTIADIAAAALRLARQSEVVTVRVCPSDIATINKHRDRLQPSGRMRFIDFEPDPHVKPGGCLIITETGTIDAQLDTQLRVLENALLARAGGQSD